MRSLCRTASWLILVSAILSIQLGWAAPSRGILLVFNSSQSRAAALHKGLVGLLKQKRAEGHFGGVDIDPKFKVYDFIEREHARSLKILGVGTTIIPFVSLTLQDDQGKPTRLIWRGNYSSPEEALSLLDQQLGIATVEPPLPPVVPDPSYSPPPPSPPPPPPVTDQIAGGGSLLAGDWLESPNGRFRFCCQPDGNCVVYRVNGDQVQPIWATQTHGQGGRLLLELGGRLRMLTPSGQTLWQSGLEGPPGEYHLQMQDDGNLVIYRRTGKGFTPLWASIR